MCLNCFPAHLAGGVGLDGDGSGVFRTLLFCPTGGITALRLRTICNWPNVVCIGSSWPVSAELLAAQDWAGIEARARDAMSLRELCAGRI